MLLYLSAKNTCSDADDDHVQNLKHDQQKQTDVIEYETCPWETYLSVNLLKKYL